MQLVENHSVMLMRNLYKNCKLRILEHIQSISQSPKNGEFIVRHIFCDLLISIPLKDNSNLFHFVTFFIFVFQCLVIQFPILNFIFRNKEFSLYIYLFFCFALTMVFFFFGSMIIEYCRKSTILSSKI